MKRRRRGIAALCSIRTVPLLPPSLSYHIPTLIVFFFIRVLEFKDEDRESTLQRVHLPGNEKRERIKE